MSNKTSFKLKQQFHPLQLIIGLIFDICYLRCYVCIFWPELFTYFF